jgi:hypothetical protein
MENFIYNSLLIGGQILRVNLPIISKTPEKMPPTSIFDNQKSILDKRQGYCLILDLPIQRNQQKKSNNNLSYSSRNNPANIEYSDTLIGCKNKALIESGPRLEAEIDQEQLYNCLKLNNSNTAVIN